MMTDSSQDEAAGESAVMPDWKAYVLAVSAMQIGPNLALAGGYQYPTSGDASWLTFGAAGLLGTLLAIVIGRFVAEDGRPLALLKHIQDELPPWAAALGAAALLMGYIVGPASGVLATTMYLDSLAQAFGIPLGYEAWMSAGIAVLIGLGAARGVAWTAKLSLILGVLCLPLAVAMTVRAGSVPMHSFAGGLTPDLAGSLALGGGAFVAMGFFIGFDCIAALASTTANPRRAGPRALKIGVIGAAVVFCIGVRLQCGAFGAHADALAQGQSPSSVMLAVDGLARWSPVVDLILLCTVVVGLVVWLSGAAIVVSSAAADGLLPRILTSKHGNDHRAIIGLSIMSIILPVVFLLASHSSALSALVYSSNFLVLLWLVPYALACMALLAGRASRNEPTYVCVAAVAALLLIAMFTLAHFVVQADSVAMAVYGAGALLVAGLAMLMARARKRGVAMRLESV